MLSAAVRLSPSITALVTLFAGKQEQGAVLGLTQSLSSVAAIVAPPLAGLLIKHELGRAWAGLAAAAALIGAALALRARAPAAPTEAVPAVAPLAATAATDVPPAR